MQQMRERLGLTDADQNIQILDDPNIKEWLFCMEHAQFVLTDSFHGACFSILFQKNFLVLRNQVRGGSRFPFLLGELGLLERMVSSPEEMAQRYAEVADTAINYAPVQEKLEQKNGNPDSGWKMLCIEREIIRLQSRSRQSSQLRRCQ